MLCPLCHTQNRDNARFCKGCGQSLVVEVVATEGPVPETERVQVNEAQSPPAPLVVEHDVLEVQEPQGQDDVSVSSAVPPPPPPPIQTASTSDENDVSAIPTQVLTPQERLAYLSRRWQQEVRSHKDQHVDDIANSPTVWMPAEYASVDIADQPTILMSADDKLAEPPASPVSSDLASTDVPPPPPSSQALEKDVQESGYQAEKQAQEAPPTEAAGTPVQTNEAGVDVPAVDGDSEEEKYVEQSGQQEAEQSEQVATEGFPILDVGAVVADRYEVTQVVSAAEQEHVYAVTDRKGYLYCWNCHSEENAEGDEFCIDCGAELQNAAYLLREYPHDAQSDEAQVLHGAIINTFVADNHTYVVEQIQGSEDAPANGIRLIAAADSDAGTVRRAEPNEDSTLAFMLERVHESFASPVGLFVVADGMGGHANGQGASRMAIGHIAERVMHDLVMPPLISESTGQEVPPLKEDDIVSLLQEAIESANTAICQYNQHEKSDMGCTLTGHMTINEHAYIFNVGDSRTYMLRDEKLYQLTNDHSLVGQLVAGGLITPDDVYTHPQRNQIFRSIGDKLNVQVDLFKQQVHPGDILLSCSDGLWEMVRDPQITTILSQAPDPQSACTQLIEAANANGGEDNVSAVVVFVR